MKTIEEKQLRLVGLRKGNEQGDYCVYQLALDDCYELSCFSHRAGLRHRIADQRRRTRSRQETSEVN